MANWPTSPNWIDPSTINSGNEYTVADGVTYEDFNKIVNNIIYLKDKLYGAPIDVATEEEMASILSNATADDNGRIYRYTGTTGTYVNGALYWLEVPSVT